MSELISVVVPIYNVEQYLENCMRSILNQTYRNLEIILVDDGSPDQCGIMCDEYAKKDKRVRVIHKQNGGLSDARNAGIEIATGEYIAFIDSDDYFSLDAIGVLYNICKEYNTDISIGALKKTTSLSDNERVKKANILIFNNKEALKEMLYSEKFSTAAPAKLYRRELFEGVRYPLNRFSEDLFTTYKVFYRAKSVAYCNQIVYYYYRRPGSITVSQFSRKQYDVVDALTIMGEEIPILKTELLPAYSSQMVEDIMAMLERKPKYSDIEQLGLWDLIKRYRFNVIKDKKANKRVKGYAILSLFGLRVSIAVMNAYYNHKWK